MDGVVGVCAPALLKPYGRMASQLYPTLCDRAGVDVETGGSAPSDTELLWDSQWGFPTSSSARPGILSGFLDLSIKT